MSVSLDYVLLGSMLVADAAAIGLLALVALFFLSLARTCSMALKRSRGARIAYCLALAGAVMQCLAGELLLFLAASAVFGYALLFFTMAGPRNLARGHALALAMLLVAGDLALLELTMLLADTRRQLSFADAGVALVSLRGDGLVEFCLVLGFGGRAALLALAAPAGRASPTNLALLPGWLALALCAVSGAVRLSCQSDFGLRCAAPLAGVLWWVPVLALIAWRLPRIVRLLMQSIRRLGAWTSRRRDAARAALRALVKAGVDRRGAVFEAERQLSSWPVAMGAGVLAAAAMAVVLFA